MENYIDYIEKVKNEAKFNKKTDFQNDFDGIYYFVNNNHRAKQIENKIIKEMIEKEKKVIIPPIIEEYKNGFLYLANFLLKNSKNRKFITEYSNEWIVFFMTEIAANAITNIINDPLRRNLNRKINLAKEYIKFLFAVEEYEVGDKLKELKEKYYNLNPEKYLIDAYEQYIKRREEYKGEKFFDRVTAVCKLREFLKKNNNLKNNFMILIEDFDDMEPIYKTISNLLLERGISVIKVDKEIFTKKGSNKINIYHCMTPLDEAELTGFKIAKLLEKKNPENIAVIVFGNDNANAIRFILERYGVYYAKSRPLSGSDVYKLFEAIVNFILLDEPDVEYFIKNLITNEASKFKIKEEDFDKFSYLLININDFNNNNIELFRQRLEKNSDIPDNIRSKLNEILGFLYKRMKERDKLLKGGFKELFKQFINANEITKIEGITIFSETLEKMDNIITNVDTINENMIYRIKTSLSIIGDIHYEFEVKEKIKFDIPILQDGSVSNILADYYFICGLDSKIEKRQDIAGTYYLAKDLGLPLPEEKTKKKLCAILDLIKKDNYEELNISYSYFDLNNREKGISNLVKAIRGINDKKIINNPDIKKGETLLRAIDFLKNEKYVPGTSYLYLTNNSLVSDNNYFKHELFQNIKDQKFLEIYLIGSKDQIPSIDSYDFKDFCICNYKFFLKTIYTKAGFKEKTIYELINLQKGNYWHNFFKRIADNKDFLSSDKKKLEELVLEEYKQYIEENKLQISYFEKNLDYFKNETIDILKNFISNEIIRRGRHSTPKEIITEKNLDYIFKNEKGEVKLSGKIDRIDKYEDKIIIWDYKSRFPNRREERFYFLKRDKAEFKDSDSAQIAFYRYLLKKAENINDKEIYGGIIFLSGEDFLDENDCRIISNNRNENVDSIVKKNIKELIEFLNKNIKEIGPENKENDKCKYCEVKFVCFKGEEKW